MKHVLWALACVACSGAPLDVPRVQLDGARCALHPVQPAPESVCDDRDLVDLDCYNPTVSAFSVTPNGKPHYCFGLRLRRTMETRALLLTTPEDIFANCGRVGP